MKIYIASSEKYVGKIQEDIYIRDAYINRGFLCEIVTLENIIKLSKPLDIVILKSIWGYHLDYNKFSIQIDTLKKKGVRLINDYRFIIWNTNKFEYLKDIKHLNVTPTKNLKVKRKWPSSKISNLICKRAKSLHVDLVVIKPAVSASGYLTHIYDINKDNDEIIDLLKENGNLEFIIQPYRPSIVNGEISIIVLKGKILYGVIRFPGVLSEKKELMYLIKDSVSENIKNEVEELSNYFKKKFKMLPDICRIDFLVDGSNYEILEVELIDPDLFFRNIPYDIKEDAIELFCGIIT